MSGLPAFLTEDSGVNSGLMIPQVTAAALVSENKSLAFPASVDSIPTSAGQEDHVSMAPIAARKAAHDRAQRRRRGRGRADRRRRRASIITRRSKTSPKLQAIHAAVRALIAALHRRPLLGGRNGRASGGGAGGRDRRATVRSRSADAGPALFLAQNMPATAQPFTTSASGPTRRTVAGAADVALGVERLALVGAVAVGREAGQDARADQVRRAALARAGLGLCRSPRRPCRNKRRRSGATLTMTLPLGFVQWPSSARLRRRP